VAGPKKFHLDHENPDVVRLERIRKKRGLSMVQFARELCVSFSSYHEIIRGVRKPRRILMRVAELLDLLQEGSPKPTRK
jgi:transcriptional regulator with XRE-family HTH domain